MAPPWLLLLAGLYAGAAAVMDLLDEKWTRGAVYAILSIIILSFAARNQRALKESENERDRRG